MYAWLLAALGLAALLTAAGGLVVCEATLQVSRRTAAAPGEPVAIPSHDGLALRASWLPASGTERCVLVLHGISDSRGSAAGFAPFLNRAGYSVLAPDLRAHGESEGDRISFGIWERQDALRWLAWMERHGCRALYGLGESLGAAVLLQTAAKPSPLRAVVAECSFADLPSIGRYRIAQWMDGPAWLTVPAAQWLVWSGLLAARWRYGVDLTLASPVASADGPLLLIHGLRDDRTPPEHSRRIASRHPRAALWLVEGAGHTEASAVAPREFEERVLAFFARHESRQGGAAPEGQGRVSTHGPSAVTATTCSKCAE